jgi:hypothetical protein
MRTNALVQLIPLLLLTLWIGLVARLLAIEKGRNVTKWTVLGFVPFVNFLCVWFFVGAANLRLERKVDELLNLQRGRKDGDSI